MLWLLQKPSSPAICTEQIIPSIFRIRNGRVLPRWRGTRVACLTALLGMGGQVTCLNITKKGKEEESPGGQCWELDSGSPVPPKVASGTQNICPSGAGHSKTRERTAFLSLCFPRHYLGGTRMHPEFLLSPWDVGAGGVVGWPEEGGFRRVLGRRGEGI